MSIEAVTSSTRTQQLTHWALDSQGSSRSSALIRIGVVLLVWSRFAGDLIFQRDPSIAGITLSLNFYLASLLMLIGYKTRWVSLWLASVLFTMYFHFGIATGSRPWAQHHTYLLAMLCLLSVLTPAGRSYSLDRYLAVRDCLRNGLARPPESGNLFGLRLIMLQLCIMYFWTAFDKTDPTWLSGERLQYIFMWYYHSPTSPSSSIFAPLMALLAWMVMVLEYALAFGLFVPKLRRYLIPCGIALHLSFYVFLVVKTFSLTCVLMYLAVIPAAKVHRASDT